MRGPLTAGRFACPVGYAVPSGATTPGASKRRLRPFSRLTRGVSPDTPLVLSPPLFGTDFSGARLCVLR